MDQEEKEMMEFLAEYMLLAFTMGAILGGAVTGHLVMLRKRHHPVTIPNRHVSMTGSLMHRE
jgi:hypothetical protein